LRAQQFIAVISEICKKKSGEGRRVIESYVKVVKVGNTKEEY